MIDPQMLASLPAAAAVLSAAVRSGAGPVAQLMRAGGLYCVFQPLADLRSGIAVSIKMRRRAIVPRPNPRTKITVTTETATEGATICLRAARATTELTARPSSSPPTSTPSLRARGRSLNHRAATQRCRRAATVLSPRLADAISSSRVSASIIETAFMLPSSPRGAWVRRPPLAAPRIRRRALPCSRASPGSGRSRRRGPGRPVLRFRHLRR